MSEPSLFIDVGNSRIKWIRAHGTLDEGSFRSGDLRSFRTYAKENREVPTQRVRLSCVGGEGLAREIRAACQDAWGVTVERLLSESEQAGVTNAYKNPGKLGADRWLAILGAVSTYGKPVVVWDVGTATTLDAVNSDGQHIGGLILPGPATMLESLGDQTHLQIPDHPESGKVGHATPGTSTGDCIIHGILSAQIGATNQFLKRLEATVGSGFRLILTGGDAHLLLPQVPGRVLHDPMLVFRGMLLD